MCVWLCVWLQNATFGGTLKDNDWKQKLHVSYSSAVGVPLSAQPCTALLCAALRCTAHTTHCPALHCTALHCTALHCTGASVRASAV